MSSALLRGSASLSSLTDVLDSFPPSQNRYLALAGLLRDQLNVNYSSTGAGLVTLWICLIGQASVLILSALVSILRLKAGKFNFMALTRNQVIRPYAADCFFHWMHIGYHGDWPQSGSDDAIIPSSIFFSLHLAINLGILLELARIRYLSALGSSLEPGTSQTSAGPSLLTKRDYCWRSSGRILWRFINCGTFYRSTQTRLSLAGRSDSEP